MNSTIMDGVRLYCLYSSGCPEIMDQVEKDLIMEFIKRPQEAKIETVTNIFLAKTAPVIYCLLLARTRRVTTFSTEAVRAHWTGDPFNYEPVTTEGLRWVAGQIPNENKMIIQAPMVMDCKPHHNFCVLYPIGKIRETRMPIALSDKINECLVRPAKITGQSSPGKFLVETPRVMQNPDGSYCMENRIESVDSGFTPEAMTDDIVTIHLGSCREVLHNGQAETLLKFTQEAFRFFNSKTPMRFL
jgi:hypothetical protein